MQTSSKVFFYIISGVLEKSFVKFVKKIFEANVDGEGNNILIYCIDRHSITHLNSSLWSYETFLPHLIYEDIANEAESKLHQDSILEQEIFNQDYNQSDFQQNFTKYLLSKQKILLSQNFVYNNNPKILFIVLDDAVETFLNNFSEINMQNICKNIANNSRNFQKIYIFSHKQYMSQETRIYAMLEQLWNDFQNEERIFWEQKD